MRPPPSVFASAAAARTMVRLPLPESPGSMDLDACEPRPCRWPPPYPHSPSSSSSDFEANAIMVLIVLLCALVCALALHGAIRCFLGGGSSDSQPQPQSHPPRGPDSAEAEQKPAAAVRAPPVVYTAGLGLGLAGAECAICLTEFEEGDGLRVLERCRHGFHTECIERWLCSRSSCPNCRSSCLAPADSSAASSSCKWSELRERRDDCSEDGGVLRQSRADEPGSSSR